MNSAVKPSFKVRFTFFRTYKSRERCTKLTEEKKMQTRWKRANELSKLTPNTNSCIAIYCIRHEWHFHFTGIIIQDKKIPQRTFPKGFQVR